MTTRARVLNRLQTFKDDGVSVATWSGLLQGDDGESVEMPGSNDRSIQFSGTFGVGGTVVLQGSNDGTNWATLNDPQGAALAKTQAGIHAVLELTRYVRPVVTGGDGSTSLTATLLVRR